jgi:8-oxo-dGTP pyrophosphatase MutT (NUDIX family)
MSETKSPGDVRRSPEITADAFRALALARLAPQPLEPSIAGPSDFDLNPNAELSPGMTLRAAAVLVGVVARDPLTVLLTERTAHLSDHAGQIAFPGGRIEEGDNGPLAAALREANEEIGLDPGYVEPLGYLAPYRTGTGFMITPVVALISLGFELTPDPAEVADTFEAPLSFLMDTANHRIDSRVWRGAERRFYAMPYEQRYIWGATAGILKSLHRSLFEG